MEGNTNGNRHAKDLRKTLAQLQADPRAIAGAAFALRRCYLADKLHRGSEVWMSMIEPKHREWATFLGSDSFEALPIADRELVRLYTADHLLVSYYVPSSEEGGNVKEIRAALNSMARIASILRQRKKERPAIDLPAAFANMEQR